MTGSWALPALFKLREASYQIKCISFVLINERAICHLSPHADTGEDEMKIMDLSLLALMLTAMVAANFTYLTN